MTEDEKHKARATAVAGAGVGGCWRNSLLKALQPHCRLVWSIGLGAAAGEAIAYGVYARNG
jgi:hypothetical protein